MPLPPFCFYSLLRPGVLAGRLRAGVRRRRLRILREGVLRGRGDAGRPGRHVVLPVRVRRDRDHDNIGSRGREMQLCRVHILQHHRVR